jgi:hypothetical protein
MSARALWQFTALLVDLISQQEGRQTTLSYPFGPPPDPSYLTFRDGILRANDDLTDTWRWRWSPLHKGWFTYAVKIGSLTTSVYPIRPRLPNSSYYAALARPLSARAVRDEELKEMIDKIYWENYSVYGARKVWWQLRRDSVAVGRCRVERLMRRMCFLSSASRSI